MMFYVNSTKKRDGNENCMRSEYELLIAWKKNRQKSKIEIFLDFFGLLVIGIFYDVFNFFHVPSAEDEKRTSKRLVY